MCELAKMRKEANNKELVRNRRARNLVAKNNKHKGGFHTPKKYTRPVAADWCYVEDLIMESKNA